MLNNTQSLILAIIILIVVFYCGKCTLKCGGFNLEGYNQISSFYMDAPIKQHESVNVSGCVSGSGCSTCPALLAQNPSPYAIDPPYQASSLPGCAGKCCEGMYSSLYPPNARI